MIVFAEMFDLVKATQGKSLDEVMVKFKSWYSLKKYITKKAIKQGFKVWCVTHTMGLGAAFKYT